MYGDTAAIRRQADRMDQRAGDVRTQARSLNGAAESAVWASIAGKRMKDRVAARHAELEATAIADEEAAAALRHHAKEVDDIKHLISLIESKVKSLITGAVDRLKDFAGAVVDGVKDMLGAGDSPSPADQRLASYTPPPPGDKAWLDAPDDLGVRI